MITLLHLRLIDIAPTGAQAADDAEIGKTAADAFMWVGAEGGEGVGWGVDHGGEEVWGGGCDGGVGAG